jgi:hypothetical protein
VSRTSLTVVFSHKPSPGITELVCGKLVHRLQPRVNVRVVSYIEERRASSGILGIRGTGLPTNGASGEHILVSRVPVLPIIPHFINHLDNGHISHLLDETVRGAYSMVKEEHRVCVKTIDANQQTRLVNRGLIYHLGTTSVHRSKREVPTPTGTLQINLLPQCRVVQDEVRSSSQHPLEIVCNPP